MFKKLFDKPPVEAWVIKQVDNDLLHLCGQGILESQESRKAVRASLAKGQFQGGIRMAGGGLVLNARLFASLVPLDGLTLTDDGQAYWQGHLWRVSQVPQRCWGFEGRLTAQPGRHIQGPALVSTEDVSDILGRVDRHTPQPPGATIFRADDELEPPSAKTQRDERRFMRPTTRRERRDDDERH